LWTVENASFPGFSPERSLYLCAERDFHPQGPHIVQKKEAAAAAGEFSDSVVKVLLSPKVKLTESRRRTYFV